MKQISSQDGRGRDVHKVEPKASSFRSPALACSASTRFLLSPRLLSLFSFHPIFPNSGNLYNSFFFFPVLRLSLTFSLARFFVRYVQRSVHVQYPELVPRPVVYGQL